MLAKYYKKLFAFTLAEILISIGIIGVVAAITMPALIKNYQKYIFINQLKTSTSIIEKGLKNIIAQDGVTKLSETKMISDLGSTTNNTVEVLENYLPKYFKILRTGKYVTPGIRKAILGKEKVVDRRNRLNWLLSYWIGSTNYAWSGEGLTVHLQNGIIMNIYFQTTPGVFSMGTVTVDVNGDKAPNTWGRDTFMFVFTDEGNLIPIGSKKYARLRSQAETEEDALNSSYYWKSSGQFSCDPETNGSWGTGCAGRIIDDNWEMNY